MPGSHFSYQHIGVEGGDRFRITHLSRRTEQGVILDHAAGLHFIEQLGHGFHASRLDSSRREVKRTSVERGEAPRIAGDTDGGGRMTES